VRLKENPSDGQRLPRTQLAREDPNTMPQGTSDEAHYLDILVMRLAKLELLVSRIKMIGIFWEHAEGLLPPLSVDRKSTAGEGWSIRRINRSAQKLEVMPTDSASRLQLPTTGRSQLPTRGRQRRRANGQFSRQTECSEALNCW